RRRHGPARRGAPGDPVRVAVADDSVLIREGVVRVMAAAGIGVVGEAGDAEALLSIVRSTRPDVVITDIKMPPSHSDEGLRVAETIRSAHPGIGVLVLSQYVEPSYAMRLLETHPEGAGYLLKERVSAGAVLVDAVQRIADGETVLDPTLVSQLLGRRRRASPV